MTGTAGAPWSRGARRASPPTWSWMTAGGAPVSTRSTPARRFMMGSFNWSATWAFLMSLLWPISAPPTGLRGQRCSVTRPICARPAPSISCGATSARRSARRPIRSARGYERASRSSAIPRPCHTWETSIRARTPRCRETRRTSASCGRARAATSSMSSSSRTALAASST